MSIASVLARQKARLAYLVERGLMTAEKAAKEAGVIPKLPPRNDKESKQK